jgi:hypothetical protein
MRSHFTCVPLSSLRFAFADVVRGTRGDLHAVTTEMSANMSVETVERPDTSGVTRAQNPYKLSEITQALTGPKVTTDQKVGGSNPSGRTSQRVRRSAVNAVTS